MKKPFLIGLILLIILIVSIISIILIVYHKNTEFYYNDLYKFYSKQPTDLMIPKVIIQTYYDKSKIPNKIYKNIQKYAPEYNHIIYDDKECIEFLEQFDVTFKDIKKLNFNIVDRFKSFEKGAHKADLFRYCYLYQHGGIYLDIKTELIKPLKNIFTQNNTLYTVLSLITDSIYQGIIAVYPRNPIIGLLINQCAFYSDIKLTKNYHIFTKFFYKCILNNIKKSKILAGTHTINGYNIYFFKETKYEKSECDNKVDRYKLCSFINDEHNNKIFKTRYFDFPW
jgi:mannosyltransferase OCH1-like enzyme